MSIPIRSLLVLRELDELCHSERSCDGFPLGVFPQKRVTVLQHEPDERFHDDSAADWT